MTAPVPHPRSPVDPSTGELSPDGPQTFAEALHEIENVKAQVASLNKVVVARDRRITELQNDLAASLGREPEDQNILSVLDYWRVTMAPGATIAKGSKRWKYVKALLRTKDQKSKELRFSVLALKAAVVGASFDEWTMDPRHRYRRDAEMIFNDAGKVDRFIARAVTFKRTYGESALAIVDELAGAGLVWLAERCGCGHTWLCHLRGGEAAQGGAQRCSVDGCSCELFDAFHAKAERWVREQQR